MSHKALPLKEARYLITPIYYLNGTPHLGHAYTTIIADFMSRFWRLAGHPTRFGTGTDEHGQKIAEAALKEKTDPRNFVDRMSEHFREMTDQVNATADDFIRTTEPRHIKAVTTLWKTLEKNGFIYKDTYKGWYAIRDEAFYKESDIKDGLAPTGAPVTWVEEPCFFFRLSAFQEKLLAFYKENPHFILPKERANEVIAWVEGGLSDLAISRTTCKWGIPVPGAEGHVMYVWIDALTNYISALGYPEPTENFQTFWPEARHVLGKDIVRFHAIYWAAFLMGAGLPLPKHIYVHGWWTVEGEKMSKSLGNVLAPATLIEAYGLDVLRYFVLREVPFGGDGDFSEKALKGRLNADLANDLGNLLQRVLGFIQKKLKVVPPNPKPNLFKAFYAWKDDLHTQLQTMVDGATPSRYLEHLWRGIALGNQFMDTLAPWALQKSDKQDDRDTMHSGLFQLLELLFEVALYLQPVMPETAQRMLTQLGYQGEPIPFDNRSFTITEGATLASPTPLFLKDDTLKNAG